MATVYISFGSVFTKMRPLALWLAVWAFEARPFCFWASRQEPLFTVLPHCLFCQGGIRMGNITSTSWEGHYLDEPYFLCVFSIVAAAEAAGATPTGPGASLRGAFQRRTSELRSFLDFWNHLEMVKAVSFVFCIAKSAVCHGRRLSVMRKRGNKMKNQ